MRTTKTTRTVFPLLLACGLAVSACSINSGEDGGASAPTGQTSSAPSPSSSVPATTSTPATPPSEPASSTSAPSAPALTVAPEPSGAVPSTAGGPDRCHTSELTGQLTNGDAGAGNRGATLVLTNTGGDVCTVYGYGGLGLVGQNGAPVPTMQDRVADPAPRTVTLQPRQAVSAELRWTAIASGDEPTTGDCEPQPGRLTVIPPDETDALSVTWPSGPVCGGGKISQTAYAAA